MAYLLAIIYLSFIYLRPAEIVPGWEAFPFAVVAAVPAVLGIAVSLLLRPRRFWSLPQDRFVIAYVAAIVVSNAAWGWISGALQGALKMAPAIFCYFLLRSAIESPRHLRLTSYALVAFTLFQAVNGIFQFHTGYGLGGVLPLEARAFASSGDVPADQVWRIRGTGIFNDPNDLAMTLVVAIPFLAGPLLRQTTSARVRVLALALLIPLVTALYYTNSRGGMLGIAVALCPYAYRRFGRLGGALATAVVLAAVLALGPSRMANLDASESSAQDRVQSWAEGLQMFKASPLFGVGFGRYTEYHHIVAHNSFVHTLGELGLFGALCYVGMGYWFFRSSRTSPGGQDTTLGLDLRQGGMGLAVCSMFLSRQYNVLLFVWLALSGAYVHVRGGPPEPHREATVVHASRIGAITVAGMIGVYVAVRLCGNWSG